MAPVLPTITEPGSSRLRAFAVLGLGGGLIIAAIVCITSFLPARIFGCDFSLWYLPGRIILQGGDPYTTSLEAYNAQQKLPFSERMGPATNPPLFEWLVLPLATLTPQEAFWLWVVTEFAAMAVVCWTSWRLLGPRLSVPAWILALGLALFSMPMFSHFWFSQAQLLLAALIMAGFYAWHRGHDGTACVLLTLAVGFKLLPWPIVVLPALASQGRKRILLLCLSAGLLVVWVLVSGPGRWESFCRHALPFLRTLANGRYYNFTIASFMATLLGAHAGWILGTLLSAALVLFAWARCAGAIGNRQDEATHGALSLLLVCSVMCSMIAWTHYFVLLIYPLCYLAVRCRESRGLQRSCSAALVVFSLACFNTAGGNPFSSTHGLPRILGANLPLLAMAALYVYFAALLKPAPPDRGT